MRRESVSVMAEPSTIPDALACIQSNSICEPPAEMASLFEDIPEALANSVEIARRCSVSIPLGEPFPP